MGPARGGGRASTQVLLGPKVSECRASVKCSRICVAERARHLEPLMCWLQMAGPQIRWVNTETVSFHHHRTEFFDRRGVPSRWRSICCLLVVARSALIGHHPISSTAINEALRSEISRRPVRAQLYDLELLAVCCIRRKVSRRHACKMGGLGRETTLR